MVMSASTSRAGVIATRSDLVDEATDESSRPAISWAAVIGGAVAGIAATLVLLTLGTGVGLTAVSPWSNSGASASTVGVAAAIWLIVVQWLSSGLGGYLAGRLRTKWTGIHTDEAYFRDTAHGFLAWALATVVGAIFLASGAASAISTGTRAVATVASGAAQGGTQGAVQRSGTSTTSSPGTPSGYVVDTLFRSETADASTNGGDVRGEAARILATDLASGDLTPEDRTYLAQLVAQRTGINQADAEKRVDDVVVQVKNAELKARQAADAARKTAATVSIIGALSMVIGAFIASVGGALGGHRRDAY